LEVIRLFTSIPVALHIVVAASPNQENIPMMERELEQNGNWDLV
jgi:hypothetical protein